MALDPGNNPKTDPFAPPTTLGIYPETNTAADSSVGACRASEGIVNDMKDVVI